MTLGERIAALRNEKKLSQGDLAEKLNVSRQSVSKWETGASVPELDKLLLLSEVFGLSLDQLVKGDASAASAPDLAQPETAPQAVHSSLSVQKILGLMLFGAGLLCCILRLLLGRFAGEGFFLLGAYLLLCGVMCLWIKRHAGLAIGWITTILILLVAPYWTGINIFAVFYPAFWSGGKVSVLHVLSSVFWLGAAALTAISVRAFWAKK